MDDVNPAIAAFNSEQEVRDRRMYERHLGRASVTIYRDREMLRVGFPATLDNISVTGVQIATSVALDEGEQIKLRLRNDVQRFQQEYRGVVCWRLETPDQTYRIGIQLLTRITSLDLMTFKRVGVQDTADRGKVWM